MRVVRFTRHYGAYNAGETAGFDDQVAAELVEKRKIAEYIGMAGLVVDVPAVVVDTPAIVTGEPASAPSTPSAEPPGAAAGKKGKRGFFGR